MNARNLPATSIKDLIISDEETYISLFREYYVSLCAYSRRYVGRKDIAEEIVSETFLKIWETRETLQIKTSIKAYLFQAVCNNSLNFLRKLKKDQVLNGYFHETASENIGFTTVLDEIEEQSLTMESINEKIDQVVSLLPEQ